MSTSSFAGVGIFSRSISASLAASAVLKEENLMRSDQKKIICVERSNFKGKIVSDSRAQLREIVSQAGGWQLYR